MPTMECRITDEMTNVSLGEIIQILSGGNMGAAWVLMQWSQVDPLAVFPILAAIDHKHLYDEHIWAVYELCGKDIHRFIYHVSMELPDQVTGQTVTVGNYMSMVDVEEFCSKRTFGAPSSYWALEHPPVETNYSYPIR